MGGGFVFIYFLFYYLLCMHVLVVCMPVEHVHVWGPQEPEQEEIRFPGTKVRGG